MSCCWISRNKLKTKQNKTLIKIAVIKVLTTWNLLLIILSLCLPTISFGGLTAWLNAGILDLLERPSAYGLIILAQEIISAKREPYGETVAFGNQHFVWLSVFLEVKILIRESNFPLGFVCIHAHTRAWKWSTLTAFRSGLLLRLLDPTWVQVLLQRLISLL